MSIESAQYGLMIGLGLVLGGGSHADANSSGSSDSYTRLIREAALVLLKEGNFRYAAGTPKRPNFDAARRTDTVAQGQEPFVTVVACSDSRVPVEAILDRGVGDVPMSGLGKGPRGLSAVNQQTVSEKPTHWLTG